MKLHSTRSSLLGAALLAAAPVPLFAQAEPADSMVFARAQRMVAGGDGAAGRAIVDSALAAIPVSSPRYAEGLFWRASIASAALDAERDYRRIAVEYSLSPRVPDALIRLAQLELARGDRMLAARHLERLLREYPPPPARATAWYWLARVGFEDNDLARGCIALDSARALAPAENAELANQIRYESGKCLTRTASTSPIAASAPSAPAAPAAVAAPAPGTVRHAAAPKAAYTVQVGAYPTRAAAERLRARLATRGFAARIVPATKIFRVRVGRFSARSDAERAAAKLKAARLDAWIVAAEPAG
jgi:cell division septation protein DedD